MKTIVDLILRMALENPSWGTRESAARRQIWAIRLAEAPSPTSSENTASNPPLSETGILDSRRFRSEFAAGPGQVLGLRRLPKAVKFSPITRAPPLLVIDRGFMRGVATRKTGWAKLLTDENEAQLLAIPLVAGEIDPDFRHKPSPKRSPSSF